MFGDKLAKLLRQSAAETKYEVELLRDIVSLAEETQESLEELAGLAERLGRMRAEQDAGREARREAEVETLESENPFGGDEDEDWSPPGIRAEGDFPRVEAALVESGMTMRDRMITKIRTVAQANEGLVSPGEAAPVILKLGLSRAKPRNLPGYMLNEMKRSGEFERVGEEGSGLYRWLPFEEYAPEEVRALASGQVRTSREPLVYESSPA